MLQRSRFLVVLFTMIVNVVAVAVFAAVPWSDWRTGMGLSLFDNAVLIGFAVRRRDRLMGKLLLFGVVLGFVELLADAWLVDVTRTLDYSPGGGPTIWRSPLWMPFAWEILAIQFAVVGGWLAERLQVLGILLAGLLGAINIPYYEEMALRTNWWAYRDCRMLLHTPYYIILGEFFIACTIVILGRRLDSRGLGGAVLAGMLGGVAIFAWYALAHSITG